MSDHQVNGPSKESSSWSVRRVLSLAGGAVLGGVFLFSAWAKAIDPLAFREQVSAEGLDFLLPAAAVALIALAAEFGLGTALLVGLRRLWVLIPSLLLVLFFVFLTGRTYLRSLNGTLEEEASCGCFGKLVDRTPAEAFWQDLMLLVPPLALAFLWTSSRRLVGARTALAGVITLGGLWLAWQAPNLPLDDLATRLRPTVEVSQICAGGDEDRVCMSTLLPEVLEGEHLVVLADLSDESFGESVVGLSALANNESLWVISAATPDEVRTFFWSWGPTFEIREAPPALLAPLYRTLPRSFRVRDGVVTETIAGLPELPESSGDGTPTL